MNRLTGLDLLRAIAAMLVALAHLGIIFAIDAPYLNKAYLSVDLFFMLSGYVMARTYESRLQSSMRWHQFMVIRIKRLWATLAIGTIIGFFYLLKFQPVENLVPLMLLALAFLPARNSTTNAFLFNPPAWSIFFELAANLAHSLALAKFSNKYLFLIVIIFIPPLIILFMPWGSFVAADSKIQFVANVFRVMVPYVIGILLFRNLQDLPRLHPAIALSCFVMISICGFALPKLAFDVAFDLIAAPLLIIAALRFKFGKFSAI